MGPCRSLGSALLRDPEDLPVSLHPNPVLVAERLRDGLVERQHVVSSVPKPMLQMRVQRVMPAMIRRQIEQVGATVTDRPIGAAARPVSQGKEECLHCVPEDG